MKIFDEYMPTPNQITRSIAPVTIKSADLLCRNVPGTITLNGLKGNIDVGLEYVESWLRGLGCVPIHGLMEDAATAEIARCQIWQWIKHSSKTAEGQVITKDFVRKLLKDHVGELRKTLGDEGFNKRKYTLAIQLYERLLLSDRLEEFLTLVAYPHITSVNNNAPVKSKL